MNIIDISSLDCMIEGNLVHWWYTLNQISTRYTKWWWIFQIRYLSTRWKNICQTLDEYVQSSILTYLLKWRRHVLATGYHAKFIREKMTRTGKNYILHGSWFLLCCFLPPCIVEKMIIFHVPLQSFFPVICPYAPNIP